MKMIIVAVLAISAVAVAAPPSQADPAHAQVLRSEYEQQPQGSYVFSFETDNGIARNENGELKQALDEENKPHEVVVVRGQYSWTDDAGKQQVVQYYADETGYHAEGDSIPKVPARR